MDGDGNLDLVAGNYAQTNRLYLNNLDLIFPPYHTAHGLATSLRVDVNNSSIPVATLTASADLPINTRVTYYLSNNGGTKWYIVQPGVEFTFPTSGMDLRWKAELASLSPLLTPRIDQIQIDTTNHIPTGISLSDSNVDENQPVGTAVGDFSTVDPDTGDTFTYTLVSGAGDTDNASFNITGASLLTSEVFDFETRESCWIRVRSTDQGGLYTEKEFMITVMDVLVEFHQYLPLITK